MNNPMAFDNSLFNCGAGMAYVIGDAVRVRWWSCGTKRHMDVVFARTDTVEFARHERLQAYA
jgi:hypothetical protein